MKYYPRSLVHPYQKVKTRKQGAETVLYLYPHASASCPTAEQFLSLASREESFQYYEEHNGGSVTTLYGKLNVE